MFSELREEDYTPEELAELTSIKEWKKKKNGTDKTSEMILILEENKKLEQIQNIASILFDTKTGLLNACYYTKYPKQCSDAATLYTIIKIDNKDVLIKVGAGEFNTEVFNQKDINKTDIVTKQSNDYSNIKGFAKTPMPLFVVNQVDSYFADEDKKKEMINNPKQYLQNNSVIVVPKRKQAYIKNDEDINFNDINILQTDTAIKKLQTALFETKFGKKDMVNVKNYMTQWQTKNGANFASTIAYLQKNTEDNDIIDRLIYFLENMVSENGNMSQMYELVKSYNKNKNQFE